jgi:hypothetical protein
MFALATKRPEDKVPRLVMQAVRRLRNHQPQPRWRVSSLNSRSLPGEMPLKSYYCAAFVHLRHGSCRENYGNQFREDL